MTCVTALACRFKFTSAIRRLFFECSVPILLPSLSCLHFHNTFSNSSRFIATYCCSHRKTWQTSGSCPTTLSTAWTGHQLTHPSSMKAHPRHPSESSMRSLISRLPSVGNQNLRHAHHQHTDSPQCRGSKIHITSTNGTKMTWYLNLSTVLFAHRPRHGNPRRSSGSAVPSSSSKIHSTMAEYLNPTRVSFDTANLHLSLPFLSPT